MATHYRAFCPHKEGHHFLMGGFTIQEAIYSYNTGGLLKDDVPSLQYETILMIQVQEFTTIEEPTAIVIFVLSANFDHSIIMLLPVLKHQFKC